jgi:hypothetical protein
VGGPSFIPDDRFFPSFERGFAGEGRSVFDGPAPIGERVGAVLGRAANNIGTIFDNLNEPSEIELPNGARVRLLTGTVPLPAGRVLATAKAARFLTRLDKDIIRVIKTLPSGARLTPSQLRALDKNLDAVLFDVLPDAVRSRNQRAIDNALDLLKGFRDSGGARFRPEFVNQIRGAQQKISEQLRALGL